MRRRPAHAQTSVPLLAFASFALVAFLFLSARTLLFRPARPPSSSDAPSAEAPPRLSAPNAPAETDPFQGGFQELFPSLVDDSDPDLRRAAGVFQTFLRSRQLEDCRGPVGPPGLKLYRVPTRKYGLFSQVVSVAHSLLEALAHGYVLSWEDTRTAYADPERCSSQSFECFFLPLTTCRASDARETVTRRKTCAFERKALSDERENPDPWTTKERTQLDPLPRLLRLSGLDRDPIAHRLGHHFLLREALRFVMRPNPALRALTLKLMKHEFKGDTNGAFAVHLRGGDKGSFFQLFPLERYTSRVGSLHGMIPSSNGIDTLYFGTDEVGALDRLLDNSSAPHRALKSSTLVRRIQYIPPSRFGSTKTVDAYARADGVSGDEDTGMLLLAQVFIFASAKRGFLGTFSSGIGQTVQALMGALRHADASELPAFDVGASPWTPCHTFSASPLTPLSSMVMNPLAYT